MKYVYREYDQKLHQLQDWKHFLRRGYKTYFFRFVNSHVIQNDQNIDLLLNVRYI